LGIPSRQPEVGYLSAFVIERRTSGLVIGKLGVDCGPAGTRRLDRCVVPARRRLGNEANFFPTRIYARARTKGNVRFGTRPK